MGALSASRTTATPMGALYERLVADVAKVAVMRKMVVTCNAVVRDETPWQAGYRLAS